MTRAVSFLLVVALLAGPALAQEKPTAVIRGRVVAADTGRPLRRAQVSVTAPELRERRSTGTNLRGEFELAGLPAGRYTITVSRSGYLSSQYGQRASQTTGRVLQIAAGETIEKLEVALQRAGVISGRVIDETGEAVSGVLIWALQPQFFRGRRVMSPTIGSTYTDDVGAYRILGLPPGEYVVMARLRETWTIPGPPKQMLGYAPTFYPSVPTTAEAQRVKVGIGEDVSSTDITLVANKVANISGTAMRSDGTPLSAARVSLNENYIGPGGAMYSAVTGTTTSADGSWHVRALPPGEYELSVSSERREGAVEEASATVMLQGADVEGVTLITQAPGSITGQLATDDGQPLPASTFEGRLRVVAEDVTPGGKPTQIVVGDDNGMVASDGRFTVRGATGRGLIKVWGLPPGWAVKTIMAGDRDEGDGPLAFAGKTTTVKIVLSSRFPTVAGTITDDRGAPAEGSVLLFPADETRWLGTADNIHLAGLDQAGTFRIQTVRPGDYLAIALPEIRSTEIADPSFLQTLRDTATRVTVREGEPVQLSLKIVK